MYSIRATHYRATYYRENAFCPLQTVAQLHILSTCYNQFIPIVGVGKEMLTLIGLYGDAKAAPVTEINLRTTGPVPADSRQ